MSASNSIDEGDVQGIEESKSYSISTKLITFNLRTLHCKAIAFFVCSIVATIYSFQNVFLVSLGIPVGDAGFITGMCYIAATITGPCMGALADKTGYRKTIFMVISLGVLITFYPMPWVARELQVFLYSGRNDTNRFQATFFDLNSSDTDRLALNSSHVTSYKLQNPSHLFLYIIGAILIVGHSCAMTMMSFVDSAIMSVLEAIKSKQGFGEQRMFASIGSGVTSFLAGFAVDQFEHGTLSRYTAIYFVLLPYILIGVPLTLLIFKYGNWKLEEKQDDEIRTSNGSREKNNLISKSAQYTDKNVETCDTGTNEKESFVLINNYEETEKADDTNIPMSRIKILKDIFKEADNIFLMTTTLLMGIVRGCYFGFLFLTIKDEMGGSKSAMGLCMTANSISSAIMFYFTKRFIDFLGGPFESVALSMMFWVIRLLVTSYVKIAWLAVLPQLLQSFCYALFWAAMVQHIHNVSSKEVYITMYTILNSLNFGVGGALGNIFGGTIYKAYGGPTILRGMAVLSFSWFILTLVYHYLVRKTLKNKEGAKNSTCSTQNKSL